MNTISSRAKKSNANSMISVMISIMQLDEKKNGTLCSVSEQRVKYLKINELNYFPYCNIRLCIVGNCEEKRLNMTCTHSTQVFLVSTKLSLHDYVI